MSVRLFVGNLPYSATEVDIRQHFGTVGDPMQVVIPTDRETGRPRGFAFVDYDDRGVAERAIQQLHGQPFKGRPLSVSEARPREARPPHGSRRIFSPRPPMGGGTPRPPMGGGPVGDVGRLSSSRAAATRRPELRPEQAAEGPRRIELREEPEPGRQGKGSAQGASERPDVQRRRRRRFNGMRTSRLGAYGRKVRSSSLHWKRRMGDVEGDAE